MRAPFDDMIAEKWNITEAILRELRNLPRDVLELVPEGLVEPPVEDGVGEGRGHPDEVREGEAEAAHHVALQQKLASNQTWP